MRMVSVTMNVFNRHKAKEPLSYTNPLFLYHVSYIVLIDMILTCSPELHVIYNLIWVSITFH